MHLGQLFYGVVCQIAGMFFAEQKGWYTASLWLGVALSLLAVIHMARVLDRALPLGEAAAKIISRGYLLRYAALLCAMTLGLFVDFINPLVVFLGYMSLKVTAYMQPFTHKALNRLLHETDPAPELMPEAEDGAGEGAALTDERD